MESWRGLSPRQECPKTGLKSSKIVIVVAYLLVESDFCVSNAVAVTAAQTGLVVSVFSYVAEHARCEEQNLTLRKTSF